MQKSNYLPGFRLDYYTSETATGLLVNETAEISIPVYHDILFVNEADLYFGQKSREKVEQLAAQVAQKHRQYAEFARRKGRRANGDIYAAYQPFNEASKAFYPFVQGLRSRLPEGGIILNLWDRSTWFSSLLPALFPEQTVLSTWEGDKNVLGYGGYDFWSAQPESYPNAELLYCAPNQPLPLEAQSVDLIFALDAFHRFDQSLWIQEALRLIKPEGTILFPHTHLSNNEPEPFFERGCKQMHGLDYQAFFDRIRQKTGRQGLVLSEPALFWFNDRKEPATFALESTPDMTDYNALLALLPADWEAPLRPLDFEQLPGKIADYFILPNKLFEIDFAQQYARLNRERIDGQVGYLMDRHPIYVRRTAETDGLALSTLETQLFYLAGHQLSIGEMANRLGQATDTLLPALRRLVAHDLALVLPLSRSAARLQYFLSTQQFQPAPAEQTLVCLWQRALERYGEAPLLYSEIGESAFSYTEGFEIVEMLANRLLETGIRKGDRVLLLGHAQAEMVLTLWACLHIGAIAVPVGAHSGQQQLRQVVEAVQPAVIFADPEWLEATTVLQQSSPVIYFDEREGPEPTTGQAFSDWLEAVASEGQAHWPAIAHTDPAVILFTSGSTSRPKGVVLSQGHLYRSARLITETFEWQAEDRFLAISDIDSMSGLRNACFAPLEVGAALLLPHPQRQSNAFALAEFIGEQGATIISGTPPLFRQFLNFSSRVKGQIGSLRLCLCTGSPLHPELRKGFKNTFGLDLLNYYGLTETSGICTSERPDKLSTIPFSIGRPVEGILQIVDEQDQLCQPGETGQLRLYSLNNMSGYWQDEPQTRQVLRQGWFYTGDLARYNTDGSISLMGRQREMVKVASGEVVYPSEIEEALLQCAAVKQVAVCKYLEQDSEQMIAFYTLKETHPLDLKALKQDLAQQLGAHKVPQRFQQVDELPLLSNGKVNKNALTAAFHEEH